MSPKDSLSRGPIGGLAPDVGDLLWLLLSCFPQCRSIASRFCCPGGGGAPSTWVQPWLLQPPSRSAGLLTSPTATCGWGAGARLHVHTFPAHLRGDTARLPSTFLPSLPRDIGWSLWVFMAQQSFQPGPRHHLQVNMEKQGPVQNGSAGPFV